MRRNETADLFIHLALVATRDGAWETAASLMGYAEGWYAAYQSDPAPNEGRLKSSAVTAVGAALGATENSRRRAGRDSAPPH